jgi:hypothetical protein
MALEERKSARKLIRCHAIVAFSGGESLHVKTQDVSPGGVCVIMPAQVPAGQVCKVAFDAPLNGKTARVMGIAKVAYSILNTEGFRTGLQFVQIDAANLKTLTDLMA